MSGNAQAGRAPRTPEAAAVFAALGDPTRLALVEKLGDGSRRSIAQLAADEPVTRQAISKHLRVLERARIVRCQRRGRERLYTLDPKRISDLGTWIDRLSAQWDQSLERLKAFVER